jgi:hypothetical protein
VHTISVIHLANRAVSDIICSANVRWLDNRTRRTFPVKKKRR